MYNYYAYADGSPIYSELCTRFGVKSLFLKKRLKMKQNERGQETLRFDKSAPIRHEQYRKVLLAMESEFPPVSSPIPSGRVIWSRLSTVSNILISVETATRNWFLLALCIYNAAFNLTTRRICITTMRMRGRFSRSI